MGDQAARPLGWGTWDARFPGCAVHLPSGLAVRVAAFGAREGRATDFPHEPATARLGPHAPGGTFAEATLDGAGGRIRVRFAAAGRTVDPSHGLDGEVEVLATSEWGLRYWVLLAIGFPEELGPGGTARLDVPAGEARYVDSPLAVLAWDEGQAAFATSPRPVGAHLYDDPAEPLREMERHGYYHRPPARPEGRWAVFRFTAVTPRIGFAVRALPSGRGTGGAGVRTAAGEAGARLAARAAEVAPIPPPAPGWRAAAIRDVLGWNTVWDPVNRRPYTPATRGWVAQKFGGWFVWQVDAFFHTMLAARAGDGTTARANLDAALACRTSHGNLAGLRAGTTDWVDRAHPPIGALASWTLYRASGDPAVLERAFPPLAAAFDWWFRARDGNGDGLLEYGSSPVGDGHFVHTKLAAMDESSNDNSPVHDEATFDERTHTLDSEDVGLNSLLVVEGELLARIAAELGRTDESAALAARARALRRLVRERLWDPRRRAFANRLWSGRFVRSLAPTSFYPLLAGVATPEQAAAMARLLRDPRGFGGDHPVAGTPHDDPAALDNVYWRGRVWPPFNLLTYLGLRRAGLDEDATWLARRGAAMFARAWEGRRSYENFNQRTGEGGDSPDSDPFYTWGALLPLIAEMDLVDLDPWDGLVFGRPGDETDAAEVASPEGRWRCEVDGSGTRLFVDGRPALTSTLRGRFRNLRWTPEGGVGVIAPAAPQGGEVTVEAAGGRRTAAVPPSPGPQPLRLAP